VKQTVHDAGVRASGMLLIPPPLFMERVFAHLSGMWS
jgi:hypothetical protein